MYVTSGVLDLRMFKLKQNPAILRTYDSKDIGKSDSLKKMSITIFCLHCVFIRIE